MYKKETVCAVVVTYNRKELLIECLDSLLKQTHPLDAIYIIDNASSDETPQLLKKKGYIKEILGPINEPLENESIIKMLSEDNQDKKVKIHYVRMNENTGGAGGFYEGVKRGYEKVYDWLWLMDDDVEVKVDCLGNLLNRVSLVPSEIAAIAPLNIDREGQIQKLHRGYLRQDRWKMISLSKEDYENEKILLKIDYSSFVGLIISKKAIAKVGFPDKDFFIWFDDVEYCCRLKDYGDIYLNKSAIITHKDKLEKEYRTDNSDSIEYLWKRYYGIRNKLILYKKHARNRLYLWFEIIYFFLRDIKNILLHTNYKILRLKLLILAYTHATLNIKGEKISPLEWIRKYKKI